MLPIGPLMEEHRLIEKLMPHLRAAVEAGRRDGRVDPKFVDLALDFVRTYADLCHHGKEEDILFKALEGKPLTASHRAIMDELVEDHKLGRQRVRELAEASEAYKRGDGAALAVILDRLEFLAEFYPAHIRKEDKVFFLPAMGYLSEGEKAAMIEAELEFDREFVHRRYREKIESLGSAPRRS
jgi:hemerythrin-like domain-containing protein